MIRKTFRTPRTLVVSLAHHISSKTLPTSLSRASSVAHIRTSSFEASESYLYSYADFQLFKSVATRFAWLCRIWKVKLFRDLHFVLILHGHCAFLLFYYVGIHIDSFFSCTGVSVCLSSGLSWLFPFARVSGRVLTHIWILLQGENVKWLILVISELLYSAKMNKLSESNQELEVISSSSISKPRKPRATFPSKDCVVFFSRSLLLHLFKLTRSYLD